MERDDDFEPLERHPEISREAQCQECGGDLLAIGTFFACQGDADGCSRYAVPVNEFGNTDAEQEREDEPSSGGMQADGGGSYYSSEAMDAARRIGH